MLAYVHKDIFVRMFFKHSHKKSEKSILLKLNNENARVCLIGIGNACRNFSLSTETFFFNFCMILIILTNQTTDIHTCALLKNAATQFCSFEVKYQINIKNQTYFSLITYHPGQMRLQCKVQTK